MEFLPTRTIKSRAAFVIFAPESGIISEHGKASEAAVAYYAYVRDRGLTGRPPSIYKRTEEGWKRI